MKKMMVVTLLALAVMPGCARKTVTAPVPGSINTLDAYAFRTLADASAAISSVKLWQQCSAASFPPTVVVDGNSQVCDPKAGSFPDADKEYLNTAIRSYNVAESAGQAYHAGASNDTTALSAALTQLGVDVANLLSRTGGK